MENQADVFRSAAEFLCGATGNGRIQGGTPTPKNKNAASTSLLGKPFTRKYITFGLGVGGSSVRLIFPRYRDKKSTGKGGLT